MNRCCRRGTLWVRTAASSYKAVSAGAAGRAEVRRPDTRSYIDNVIKIDTLIGVTIDTIVIRLGM